MSLVMAGSFCVMESAAMAACCPDGALLAATCHCHSVHDDWCGLRGFVSRPYDTDRRQVRLCRAMADGRAFV